MTVNSIALRELLAILSLYSFCENVFYSGNVLLALAENPSNVR